MEGMNMIERLVMMLLAGIAASVALIWVPIAGTPLRDLETAVDLIGVILIIVFATVIIYRAIRALFGK